jgi:predicted SAM-dependent methyltransferase
MKVRPLERIRHTSAAVRRVWIGTRIRRFPRPYRLHLGCGKVHFNGWVNIDADRSLDAADIVWNLAYGVPVEDSSCALIYNEHFIEHLNVEQGLACLRECYRALSQGGVLRVATPSLDFIIERFQSDNWREQDWLNWPEYRFVRTRAEMLNIAFRWWGHQWLYDREELHRRLEEAGFRGIRGCEWGKSDIPELRNRETRPDSILICEAEK